MKLLEQYYGIQQQIFDYFGYVEDWAVIPISDKLGYHWMICGPENEYGTPIVFSPEPFTLESIDTGETIYSDALYTQCHLPQWVYRTPDHTMICVDTRTDGNKFLSIFENKLECKDEEMKQAYLNRW